MSVARAAAVPAALLLALALACVPGPAAAQLLPVDTQVSGNTVTAQVGGPLLDLAQVTISFSSAQQLSEESLGLHARSVSVLAPDLLARLPGTLTSIPSLLPVLLTVAPPAAQGLAFDRLTQVEIHTARLPYSAGSRFRLFKASHEGAFQDITTAILPGSVRARGTTGTFSQFLILVDLRPTSQVVQAKFDSLQSLAARATPTDAVEIEAHVDAARDAVDRADYAGATIALDDLDAYVSAHAGGSLPETWTASGAGDNLAGELLAASSTLRFSIGYLRDYGD